MHLEEGRGGVEILHYVRKQDACQPRFPSISVVRKSDSPTAASTLLFVFASVQGEVKAPGS